MRFWEILRGYFPLSSCFSSHNNNYYSRNSELIFN